MFLSWELLGTAWFILEGLYWVCLTLGGGLIAVSSMSTVDSDVDLDFDADGGLELDVDVDADTTEAAASSLASWFSVNFLVYFMGVFGLIGATLTGLSEQTPAVIAGAALAGGLLVGQAAHQMLRKLRSTSGDSTPQASDYVNKTARVTIELTKPKTGEVVVRVGRAERYVPAIARHADAAFVRGDAVGVVSYHGGIAEVVSQEEFEFLTSGHEEGREQKTINREINDDNDDVSTK